MKKYLLVVVVCFISFSAVAENKGSVIAWTKVDTLPTLQLITFLQQMNVTSYHGQPVDSFLLAIPSNFYNMKIYPTNNSKGGNYKASYLIVDFTPNPSGPGAIIYVKDFTHMSRYSPNANWDINLFRKENIYRIKVYKDQNVCINGECM